MDKTIKIIATIIRWLAVIVIDICVFLFLGLYLMNYEDFYNESKGEFWSLASMETDQKIAYICYIAWIIMNIIGVISILIYYGRKIYKRY